MRDGYKKVGHSFPESYSLLWARRNLNTKLDILQFPNQAFKISTPDRYLVVVTGKDMITDLQKAPDDVLSMREALDEVRTRVAFQTHCWES